MAIVAAFTLSRPGFAQAPLPDDASNILVLDLSTGPVEILMRPDLAPLHVERIKKLVREGF